MENAEGDCMTTILLVDDEESVRNLVTATLKGEGYKLLLARDSDQAMQMSDAHEGSIELLIVDQVMPPFMGGPELAACIRMLRPEVKVLYISGYNASDAVLDELGDASADFLRKPFLPDILLKKVRRLAGEAVADGAA